jgi:propionyl-CoA carboxylase alpha chain
VFSKILIANRGEIAVRIIRTCRRLGIATVVVHSDADANSLAVEMADEAVAIGPAPAAQSYLVADRIIAAAKATGAEAVHPGYGFLSERADFARALAAAGIGFIGPNADAIDAMGDKLASKRFAAQAGVSTVPGFPDALTDAEEARRAAEAIGYPVMLKASAGGGGKGMRIVHAPGELADALAAARAEALSSFGDERVLIEKFVQAPRHIEIQVLGDRHGNLVHLNERECSIQRRNQKVIEEAPSPFVDAAMREAMGAQAIALSRAVNYDSAGTVEFIVDGEKNFYFLEMNTRLQVEHPVTELTTGVDLVEQMIRVAAGEKLTLRQKGLAPKGWAVEARVYAEDPYRDFAPSIGRLTRYRPPEQGARDGATVRVDDGVREGDQVSMFYDPMIAKLSVHAADRAAAVEAMSDALDGFEVEGVRHNIPLLSAVMDQERFRECRLTTAYLAEEFPDGFADAEPTPWQSDLMTATAAYIHVVQAARRANGRRPRTDWIVELDHGRRAVRLTPDDAGLTIAFPDEARTLRLTDVEWRPGRPLLRGRLDGRPFAAHAAPLAEGYRIRHRASAVRAMVLSPRLVELHDRLPERAPADVSRLVLSPMPGLVVSVAVTAGQEIKAGEAVAVIEAMKMQNLVRAERDGVIASVAVAPGDSVAADQVLAELV